MIHGGVGYIRNGKLFVPHELLKPLSIFHQTSLFGIYYPSKYESCSMRHCFVFSPIPHRQWPSIGRYVIRLQHKRHAINAITNLLSELNISILFSDAVRSGYRFDTWNLTVSFEDIAEADKLYYETNESIYKEAYEKIKTTKCIIEDQCHEVLFRDEKDIQLKDSVIDIPHTALPYFHQESLLRASDSNKDAWIYRPFSVEYDQNANALYSDDEIIHSITEHISTSAHCVTESVIFISTDIRDVTIRTALLSTNYLSHLIEANYTYERRGMPHTSRGILAHVLSQLPEYFILWKMTNRTRTSSVHMERGSTSFIIEDARPDSTNVLQLAQERFNKIKDSSMPSGMEHLRIVSVNVRPLSIARMVSRLETNKLSHGYDVFISYSSADMHLAEKLQNALKDEGLSCFMAGKELKAGDVFSEKIRRALLESREICILFTPNSKNSEWVMTEWGAAWALDKVIIPILYRTSPSDLPERLRSLQSIDFHQLKDYVFEAVSRQEEQSQS